MSQRDWLPEDTEHATEPGKPYILVPQVRFGANYLNRLNLAGWPDTGGDAYVCETCKKQVRLSLAELRIFPLVKKETDLFQFFYEVPNHRSGGAFSAEICKGSGKQIVKDREMETSVRFTRGSESVASESGEAKAVSGGPSPTDEDVKKKVEAMSPEETEERYNALVNRPITELTDAEYAERLALVDRLTSVKKKPSS